MPLGGKLLAHHLQGGVDVCPEALHRTHLHRLLGGVVSDEQVGVGALLDLGDVAAVPADQAADQRLGDEELGEGAHVGVAGGRPRGRRGHLAAALAAVAGTLRIGNVEKQWVEKGGWNTIAYHLSFDSEAAKVMLMIKVFGIAQKVIKHRKKNFVSGVKFVMNNVMEDGDTH